MDKVLNYKKYAVVIGTDNHNCLGVVRSLGQKGIPVLLVVITDNLQKKTAVEYSKYVKKSYRINNVFKDLVPTLIEIGTNIIKEKGVVFVTSDTIAKIIDENKADLEKYYILSKINDQKSVLSDLLDKSKSNKLAQEVGLKVPNSIILQLNRSYKGLINNVEYPCIVKPLASFEGQKSDIKIIENENQLKMYLEFLKNSYHRVLVQKYIDGKDSKMVGIIGFVKQSGEVIISGIMDKKREYPLNTGSTSYGSFTKNVFNLDIEKVKEFIIRTKYIGFLILILNIVMENVILLK